jgi:hypothetical protein
MRRYANGPIGLKTVEKLFLSDGCYLDDVLLRLFEIWEVSPSNMHIHYVEVCFAASAFKD